MKKELDTIYRKVVMSTWIIPIPVLAVVMGVLNYVLGERMTKINSLYASIEEITKTEFIHQMITLVGVWLIIRLANSVFSKIANHRIMDRNYMRWVEKLTYSKVSSITSIGTGGVHNAISAVSQADKMMLTCTITALPNITPFITICKREYETAGILPVVVNFISMALIVILNIVVVNLKANKISAEAGASMHSVTVDCIHNSKTVKYFQKEKWSINRQGNKQKEVFVDFVNLKKTIICNLFPLLYWIPTVINVPLCWNNKAVILFILMSDYSISNIAESICSIMDCYSEKVANLKILGSLEPDKNIKKPLEKELNIKGIEFKYSEDSNVTFKINHINIKKGHRYCITGKSGFGKSTFIKLVTKTVEPQIGNIDPVDCIYMFAESEMFNDTVMENISLGDDTVTDDEIKEILSKLEIDLDINPFTDSIGEKGEKLSTGQRQRINLARVIVYARRHPGVLVALDEVTSALDEVTSINCINYLTSEFERLGTTLLYVSNKSDYKNTNLITDNIFVERNGDVVNYVQN